jgi:hypothetical protein
LENLRVDTRIIDEEFKCIILTFILEGKIILLNDGNDKILNCKCYFAGFD